MEVWVAGADGSEPAQLTHGPGRWQGSPAWSPDGRHIAFDSQAADGSWHIWTVDIAERPPAADHDGSRRPEHADLVARRRMDLFLVETGECARLLATRHLADAGRLRVEGAGHARRRRIRGARVGRRENPVVSTGAAHLSGDGAATCRRRAPHAHRVRDRHRSGSQRQRHLLRAVLRPPSRPARQRRCA